jgi:hypothetical protein
MTPLQILPKSCLPSLRRGEAGAPPYSGAHRARPSRRQGRQIRPQADPHPAPAERGPQAPPRRRDATQRRPQLQCQPEHDFEADSGLTGNVLSLWFPFNHSKMTNVYLTVLPNGALPYYGVYTREARDVPYHDAG